MHVMRRHKQRPSGIPFLHMTIRSNGGGMAPGSSAAAAS